jgi:hypothetical protein
LSCTAPKILEKSQLMKNYGTQWNEVIAISNKGNVEMTSTIQKLLQSVCTVLALGKMEMLQLSYLEGLIVKSSKIFTVYANKGTCQVT